MQIFTKSAHHIRIVDVSVNLVFSTFSLMNLPTMMLHANEQQDTEQDVKR